MYPAARSIVDTVMSMSLIVYGRRVYTFDSRKNQMASLLFLLSDRRGSSRGMLGFDSVTTVIFTHGALKTRVVAPGSEPQ